MLKNIFTWLVISITLLGNISAWSVPLSEAQIEYYAQVSVVWEFCPDISETYRWLYDNDLAEKLGHILYKYNYQQISIVNEKISELQENTISKLHELYWSDIISEYNKLHISSEIYNKSYKYLDSVNLGSAQDFNEILGLACYPYVVTNFRAHNDHMFFTNQNDYQNFVLYNTVRDVLGRYLREQDT